MMKKIISIVLCILMMLVLFNGCTIDSSKQISDAKVEDSGTTQKITGEVSNFNKTGYPIVNEPVTVTIMHSQNPLNGPYGEMEYFKEMENLTNIKIEFIPISANYNEKKGLAFASGDIPDVVMNVSSDEVSKYGIQGKMLIPLQDLINETTPNIKKAIEEYPELLPVMTELDGNIYVLATIVQTATVNPHYVFGRTDWLKEINEDLPETVDDFYNIAKKIKEWDNTKIPIVYGKERMSVFITYLLSAYGELLDYRFGLDANDKVVYVPMTDQFRDTLEFTHRLYAENLLDDECFSQDNVAAIAKVKNDIVAICGYGASFGIEQFKSGQYDVEMFPPLTSPTNNEKHLYAPNLARTNLVAFTTKLENPEIMMRWFDVNYSKEDVAPGLNRVSSWLGIRDKHWRFVGEDEYERIYPSDWQGTAFEYISKHVALGSGFCSMLVHLAIPDQKSDPGQYAFGSSSLRNQAPYFKNGFPDNYLKYTPEEMKRLQVIQNDLYTNTDQMIAKLITGQDSFDNYEKYIKTMEDIGVSELIKIKEAAYERYKNVTK